MYSEHHALLEYNLTCFGHEVRIVVFESRVLYHYCMAVGCARVVSVTKLQARLVVVRRLAKPLSQFTLVCICFCPFSVDVLVHGIRNYSVAEEEVVEHTSIYCDAASFLERY